FAKSESTKYGENLEEALRNFALGVFPDTFDGMQCYSTVKLFSAWWAAEFAEQLDESYEVLSVSPGASLGTSLSRDVSGLKGMLVKTVFPRIGGWFGVNQSMPLAAKRYVDVLTAAKGKYKQGRAYFSAPKKVVGPLVEQQNPHLYDPGRRKLAWALLEDLTQRAPSG
ncbi:MAG: hypothetical protein AAF826_13810, partial [Pseudomonadota bacterium]